MQNYGAYYEQMPAGIAGPVKLIDGNDTINLSNTTWNYQVPTNYKRLFLLNYHKMASFHYNALYFSFICSGWIGW